MAGPLSIASLLVITLRVVSLSALWSRQLRAAGRHFGYNVLNETARGLRLWVFDSFAVLVDVFRGTMVIEICRPVDLSYS